MIVKRCVYCNTQLINEGEISYCPSCGAKYFSKHKTKLEVFGISSKKVSGPRVVTRRFGSYFLVVPLLSDAPPRVSTHRHLVTTLNTLYRVGDVEWVCVQVKNTPNQSIQNAKEVEEVPTPITLGMNVLRAWILRGVYVLVDKKKISRVCIDTKTKTKNYFKYSRLYALLLSLYG